MSVASPARILVIGQSSGPLAAEFHRRRHRLTVMDTERSGVAALLARAPLAIPVVGAAEALPFEPCSFDAIALAQGFHRVAPGLALAEFARVLRPGGRLLLSYTVRDDSVPWVRRLVTRLRQDDPNAMPGDYGSDSVEAVAEHACFPSVEARDFRLWFPVDQDALVAMVARTSTARSLDAAARETLLADVAALYRGAARAPEPLLLPYRVRCWRAQVDHAELSLRLTADNGLRISL